MKCNYRNCKNEIGVDRAITCKYCNSKCRRNESKYVGRKKKFLSEAIKREMEKVKLIKLLKVDGQN
jgi:hypothetical protein